MKLIEFVFSPTGGTKQIADLITNKMATNFDIDKTDAVKTVDLTDQTPAEISLADKDIAIIAVPVYNGRVPKLALDRIKSYNGNCAMAVAVVVYGNRDFDDALVELGDTLRTQGFCVVAGITAIAEHSMVPEVGTSRPDVHDMDVLATFADVISTKIKRRHPNTPDFPGKHPYKKSGKVLRPRFLAKRCGGCNKCAEACPAGAIDPVTQRVKDKKLCIGCLRCVELCPNHARALPSLMHGLVRTVLKAKCRERKAPQIFV